MSNILIADDEEALRMMMGRQLRRAGHSVTLAEDGMMALELLGQSDFDVVVSDMKMPRLDGMGLLERAKTVSPTTEFIILTGHGSLENALVAFKTGNLFDYLLKPLEDIHELDAVVARALERRTLRSENKRLVDELEARIEELEVAKQQLTEMAERDGLTGLLNHRVIHERLNQFLEADDETPVAVILLDMDGFKSFNDTYGHPTGDAVLRHLAETLTLTCRDDAIIGRCGGDEFMLVFPNATAQDAQRSAQQIRLRLTEYPFRSPSGGFLPVPLCIGVADVTSAGRSAANIVVAADAALYESKHKGGDSVTIHMENAGDDDEGELSKFGVLDGLVTAIDHKDRYTKRHSEDVTRYALELTQALDLSDEAYSAVRVAGLLHDVGKIGVPDSILKKPGKLTQEEYEVMKSHVTVSALIIHGLPRLGDILSAVANHHERWDGKGYPAGVSGEDIPLLGRIMGIADAFSAMTLDRPYRSALPFEDALIEIEKGKGTQFDPDMADVFIKTMRTKLAVQLKNAA